MGHSCSCPYISFIPAVIHTRCISIPVDTSKHACPEVVDGTSSVGTAMAILNATYTVNHGIRGAECVHLQQQHNYK